MRVVLAITAMLAVLALGAVPAAQAKDKNGTTSQSCEAKCSQNLNTKKAQCLAKCNGR